MTAREIAARLNASPSGHGQWIAHCPAHDDRSPSLTLAEGRGGRALLFCFAGCVVDAIARALGIGVRDLFGDDSVASWRSIETRCKPTTGALQAALGREAESYRQLHGIEGTLLTHELNAIRRAVAIKLGVVLDDLPRLLHEGSYGGLERDPAWPALFERALRVAAIELLGWAIDFGELRPPHAVLVHAEEHAAAEMRSIEREARRALIGTAA
jgi:hypothetical protein